MSERRAQWTVGSILTWTGQYFREKGVASPRLDAEVLLSHVLGQDRLYLYVHFDRPLDETELAAYRQLVKERARHKPVAYLTGRKEFMGLDFTVTPDVLIPRPDTEILVLAAIERLQELDNPAILDIGVGSGAIIVSLLVKLPSACGWAVDISPAALAVARANGVLHEADSRLELRTGDLFGPVAGQRFDAIISNPPYIPADDISTLALDVQQEPLGALHGGKDGLDFYRHIVKEAPGYVKSGGFVALEVGIYQAGPVAAMAEESGCFLVEAIIQDYGGIDRVVVLRAKGHYA